MSTLYISFIPWPSLWMMSDVQPLIVVSADIRTKLSIRSLSSALGACLNSAIWYSPVRICRFIWHNAISGETILGNAWQTVRWARSHPRQLNGVSCRLAMGLRSHSVCVQPQLGWINSSHSGSLFRVNRSPTLPPVRAFVVMWLQESGWRQTALDQMWGLTLTSMRGLEMKSTTVVRGELFIDWHEIPNKCPWRLRKGFTHWNTEVASVGNNRLPLNVGLQTLTV